MISKKQKELQKQVYVAIRQVALTEAVKICEKQARSLERKARKDRRLIGLDSIAASCAQAITRQRKREAREAGYPWSA